jgi:hypothetical protein
MYKISQSSEQFSFLIKQFFFPENSYLYTKIFRDTKINFFHFFPLFLTANWKSTNIMRFYRLNIFLSLTTSKRDTGSIKLMIKGNNGHCLQQKTRKNYIKQHFIENIT